MQKTPNQRSATNVNSKIELQSAIERTVNLRGSLGEKSERPRQGLGDVGASSWGRASLRMAVFDLAPVRQNSSATNKSKKQRSLARFAHNPLYRRTTPQRTTSAAARHEDEVKHRSLQAFFEPLQLIKAVGPEESHQVYVVNKDVKKAGDSNKHPREPATVHMVTLPRRGLIKLTGLAYEFDNPGYYDDRKERPAPRKYWDHTKFRYVLGSDQPNICPGFVPGQQDVPQQNQSEWSSKDSARRYTAPLSRRQPATSLEAHSSATRA